jgi:N-hydroxyarylamine O-acetyltransferase
VVEDNDATKDTVMDIQTYLQRIKYRGATSASAANLRALHRAHMYSVPFENLDIHLGRPIELQRHLLYDKIILRRRGGFCYELNGLFAWLLEQLGFNVTLLSARDVHPAGGVGPEHDHLTLMVTCPADGTETKTPWLVDVGWGDSFTEPLRLDRPGIEQQEGLRAYRIDQLDDYFFLWQRNYAGEWGRQYRFTLEPQAFTDFEATCRYHQTSPKSSFTQQRICSLATADGRVSLDDHRLIVTEHGQRQEFAVDEEIVPSILEERFGMKL